MKNSFFSKSYCCYLGIFTLFLLVACKTKTPAQAVTTDKKQENKKENLVPKSQPTAYPTEPGTCVIQGYIINILPKDPNNINEPCKSYPCNAKVIITKCHSCGFGLAKKPVEGDTLEVHFTHSLASSEEFKSVYPAKVILTGLKQDQPFEAMIKVKLLPSEKLYYEIGNYEVLR